MQKKKTRIRVGTVDDDKAIRDWVRRSVEGVEGFEFVAEFESAEEVLKVADTLEVDVLLLDMQLEGMNGVTCLSKIRQRLNKTSIAIFTAYPD